MTEMIREKLYRLAKEQPVKIWTLEEGEESYRCRPKVMFDVNGPEIVPDFETWGYTRSAASYIAAACPANVLALLDVIQTLEIRLREVAKACATAEQERDQLREGRHG